ncbi:uncharacterized protein LOC130677074 [Microplitis mediator]|uniref:uncharacterized protein LOC130677074 n=1 Tax=Microplitis mediator TaxID=375433 RepID=UPI0025547CEE|nr:uncharacterized protein LOC130677074 [Microplitis mediator]XP_057339641.1 uncharacterized protein LOC130677074 [Microplitis mediator]XP_057339643.1 uncharacterized protein LOC130677074 [Microplitis mediator]
MYYRLIFISLFFNYYLNAFYIKIPSIERDKRIDLTNNLIERCFPDVKAKLFFTDSPANKLYKEFYKSTIGTVTLLDKSENFSIPINQNMPVPCVIMILTSSTKLKEVLVNEKWRNFNKFSIILDGGDINNGCVNAQSFLMAAWNNDILNVIFMCWDYQNQITQLYAFNPYTDFAPRSWKKISIIPAINNHSWTLFSRIHNADEAACRHLFFDKTNNLGGYPIKTNFINLPPYMSQRIVNGVRSFEGYDYEVIKILSNKLNARLVFGDEIAKSFGDFSKNDNKGLMGEVITGKIDFALDSLLFKDFFNKAEMTYPSIQTGLSAMTKHRKSHVIAGQLFSFLPLSIIAIFLAINILIFVLLRYVFKDPYSKYLIDISRFFLNLPLPSSTVTNPGKIIFGTTLIAWTVSNIVVQSYLNTSLVSKNTARNVEDLDDLNELKYNVHAFTQSGAAMKRAGVKNVEFINQSLHCSQLGKYDAYIATEELLRKHMGETCHMPKRPLITGVYLIYSTRRNWPIFPKINDKLKTLVESGLTNNRLSKILMECQLPKLQQPDQYQVISMEHIKYVFYIYIALNLISLIVFFIELSFVRLLRITNQVLNLLR